MLPSCGFPWVTDASSPSCAIVERLVRILKAPHRFPRRSRLGRADSTRQSLWHNAVPRGQASGSANVVPGETGCSAAAEGWAVRVGCAPARRAVSATRVAVACRLRLRRPELIGVGSTPEATGGNVAELSATLRAPGLRIYRRRRTFTLPEKAPARTRTM